MSSSLDVAVVIPCYNAAAWLEETLSSVKEQSRPAAEVVVVDDGSTDGSGEIAERCGVRCVRQEQRGPAAARNRGIAETTSALVAFLDADDRFAPRKLELQAQCLEDMPGAVLCCTDAWVVRDGQREELKNEDADLARDGITFDRLMAGNPVICSSVLARRSVLEAVGGFDEDPVLVATEDYDLWLRMVQRGSLVYLDEPLVDYRVVAGQLSDDERFVRGVDRAMEKVVDARGPEVRVLADQRRAAVRLDAAYHLARAGRGADARRRLTEARELGRSGAAGWKTWLRSWAP